MKINVITTIEIDKDVEEQLTNKDVDEVYEEFREIIKSAHLSQDLTNFLFMNADTNMQIEDEVE